MPSCAIINCRNNTKKFKKNSGITFHRFPADPVIADIWTNLVQQCRQEKWWKPGKSSVICSSHFNESDFHETKRGLIRLSKGAIPQNAICLPVSLSQNMSICSQVIKTVCKSEDKEGGDMSPTFNELADMAFVSDEPREIALMNKLRYKTALHAKHARLIKTLREKVRRLKKANSDLKSIIKALKQQRLVENDKVIIHFK